MSRKKTIEVNEASIVDLKAELFRKEEQFKKEKDHHGIPPKVGLKKPPAWAKQKKQVKTSSLQSVDTQSEQENLALVNSRQALEAKAALYDKMSMGEIEDEDAVKEDGGRYLVDFHKKVYSKQQNRSEDEDDENKDVIPETTDPSEEWVDYVDNFGRQRRCLRKDLPDLKAMDKECNPQKRSSPPTLLSDDMRREMLRRKWEKEEEERMNKPVGDVHYQDVQYEEMRSHGVGYYQFSRQKEQRQEQFNMLNQYREQTIDARVRREKLKEKRKAALDIRLAKIRDRKMRKLQGTEEIIEDDVNNDETENNLSRTPHTESITNQNEPPTLSEIQERVQFEAERMKKAREDNTAGNWKRHQLHEHEREASQRLPKFDASEDRDQEFAPPSFYYDDATERRSGKNNKTEQRQDMQQSNNEMSSSHCETFGNQYEAPVSQAGSQNYPNHTTTESYFVPSSLPPPPKETVSTSYLGQTQWQSQSQPQNHMAWPHSPYQYTPSSSGVYMPQGGPPNSHGVGVVAGYYGHYPGLEQAWGYPGIPPYDGRQWPPQDHSAHPPSPFAQVPSSESSDNPLSKLISFCQQNESSL